MLSCCSPFLATSPHPRRRTFSFIVMPASPARRLRRLWSWRRRAPTGQPRNCSGKSYACDLAPGRICASSSSETTSWGAAAKPPPPAWLKSRSKNSAQVFDPQYREVGVVAIDDDPIGACEMAVGGCRDMSHCDGIFDIAADHVEVARPDRDDDVAMPRKATRRQLVVEYRLPTSPVADQVTALRGIDLDPLGGEGGSGFEPEAVTPRRVDIVGMGFRIREAAAGSGDPHHVGDKGSRPSVVAVF